MRRAGELAGRPGRALLGITGAPGAGKSELSAALAAEVPGTVVVPMDGFHLPTAELTARDWVAERGTPRTFDAAAFVALLRRLRAGEPVRAPDFDRSREEPVPDAIDVPADARLVVVEGNYLLLNDPPWADVADLLDETWFVEVAEEVRRTRLIDRHVKFGRTRADASARVISGSDAANAEVVAATRPRADLLVTGG